jgi:hypothetical protein
LHTHADEVVVSGKHMFDILPAEYKSLAVRTKVRYVSVYLPDL